MGSALHTRAAPSYLVVALVLALAIWPVEPIAAQQVRAGVLTCDVSAGMGLVLSSQKLVSCTFNPEGPGMREDYDGSISRYGLDLGSLRPNGMGCFHKHSCCSRRGLLVRLAS